MQSIAPLFEGIDAAIANLGDVRDKPAGTVRLTSSEHPANAILGPKLLQILPLYPDIKIELMVENGFTDIAGQGFDAGVRLGESLEKNMIAVRIGPDMRMVVVGSPAYFANHPIPETPQDLTGHNCVNLRLTSSGAVYAWEFEKDGRALRVRVEGQLTLNSASTGLDAVLAGIALAYLPEDVVQADVQAGRLVRVLDDWCQTFAGFHLYYPSRRQTTPAFAVVVDALRYRP